jgi:hypothetical protein
MNINKSFTITKSNSFTNSNTHTHTHTYTITSTNTNTHTNLPLIEMQLCKGFADNYCQNRVNEIWLSQVDFIQQVNPSTLPDGRCLPGRTPLNKTAIISFESITASIL